MQCASNTSQLVLGCYQKPFYDPTEDYQEARQFTINDKMLIMRMYYCPSSGPEFEHGICDQHSEAVVFIYHVSDRQQFLELPSVYERACNTVMPHVITLPQVATPQLGPGVRGGD
jgi:hypothetical protein